MTTKFKHPPLSQDLPQRLRYLVRRLAAMVYDGLVVYGLWIGITFIAVFLNKGNAIQSVGIIHWIYAISLLCLAFTYFAVSWRYGGKTIGLKALKLQLVSTNPETHIKGITFPQVCIRFVGAVFSVACGGLGIFWILLNRQGLAWQDKWSRTTIR